MRAETGGRAMVEVYRDELCGTGTPACAGADKSVCATLLQCVVFFQQDTRSPVAKVPDLRLDIALERNLSMAGVNRRVDADFLQLIAESLRRQVRGIIGQRLLIIRKRSLGHDGNDIRRLVRALPDLVGRSGVA